MTEDIFRKENEQLIRYTEEDESVNIYNGDS